MNNDDQLRQLFAALNSGDFMFRIDASHPMASEINSAMAHLDGLMLQNLKTTVEATADGFETTIAMGKLNQTTNQVAERSEAMAAATEEMSATVSTMAEHAKDVSHISESAKNSVEQGEDALETSVAEMVTTVQQMEDTIIRVKELSNISRDIEILLGSIRKISDQTNLLALNATIEAARAGAAGRGFAVVASEVKELSNQSKKATEDISAKSQAINEAVDITVESIEQIEHSLKTAANALDRSRESMRSVVQGMHAVDDKVQGIQMAADDQRIASTEIAEGVTATAAIAHDLSQLASNTLQSADELDGKLRDNLATAGALKVTNAVLQLAKTDHMLWKKRLVDMVLGRGDIEVNEVVDHHQCRLGKWYDGAGREIYGNRRQFMELEDPHAEVHRRAKSAVQQYNSGNLEAAIAEVEKIGPLSTQVVSLLSDLEQ
ncbi:MAG: methyl-accepting chemotaxis protein [Mariprofundales bacterium]|nr:methyl-accepting chemotaxis protein [Mariprofundales bacterium]